MRLGFSILYAILTVALATCSVKAYRSRKAIGRSVALLTGALIPPVLGNLVIIDSDIRTIATIGYYIYFLGMDLVMYALLRFTFAYCKLDRPRRRPWRLLQVLLAADAAQLLLNPLFGHAFGTEPVVVHGMVYYRLLPFVGQNFHRILDYAIFAFVLVIYLLETLRSDRITTERYASILVSMVIIGLWQTFYIFSRTPVDRSMIGYGVFGLLVFYFSLHFRSIRLLDRMLATLASQLPEALFFFNSSGQCIWANQHGVELLGLANDDFDHIVERLEETFGTLEEGADWTSVHTIGSGETLRSYVMEHHEVADDHGRLAGSYLSIRDNSDEQRTLQREAYNAAHDGLTKVYNRTGYDLLLAELDLASTCMLLIDLDHFKDINDTFGHEVGDKVLIKLADVMSHRFRSDDHIARIGGDEFVVLMSHTDQRKDELITARINQINRDLSDTADGLPPVSVSVGVAYGFEALTTSDLFSHADAALYDTKRAGRNGFTFYGAA